MTTHPPAWIMSLNMHFFFDVTPKVSVEGFDEDGGEDDSKDSGGIMGLRWWCGWW